MKFTVSHTDLSSAVSDVSSVIAKDDAQPALKRVQLRVVDHGGVGLLTAFNGIVSITKLFRVNAVTGSGTVLLSPRRISAVAGAAEDDLTFTIAKGQVSAKCGPHSWNFSTALDSGFPDIHKFFEVERSPVTGNLAGVITRVRSAVSQDALRPSLRMINLCGKYAWASDGSWLQRVPFDYPFPCGVPANVLPVLAKYPSNTAQPLNVGETENTLVYGIGQTLITVQKLSAKFPAIEEALLVPAFGNDQSCVVSREEMLGAISTVRGFSDPITSAVVLSLNTGSVTVQAKDRSGDVATSSITADWIGSPRHLTFNHTQLTSFLRASTQDQIELKIGKDLATKPTTLYVEDPDGYSAVLSQTRMDW